MLFNSLQFVFFFLIVFGIYVVLPHRAQNRLLLLSSYVFYGAWDYRFLSLLALSTLVDYCVARLIAATPQSAVRKRYLAISIAVNLGILAFFKYFNFFVDSFSELMTVFGLEASPVALSIILPVGISFYTFQTMSYTIDVYRGQVRPCRSIEDFALYVSFFPQLVAGPIERPSRLIPQIASKRVVTSAGISAGLYLVLLGFFKKVFIADNLAPTVDQIFSQEGGYDAATVLLGVSCFAVQIYCDFSGYTDIARGIAKMLGFDLMRNFNLPYFARNPSDFWRRWHISLSSWLRDYLYVPLGGNRKGSLSTYRNLMITMVLGGLWHGAAWNFVLWGAYHGMLLCGYRLLRQVLLRTGAHVVRPEVAVASVVLMLLFTLYGWLLFRATSFDQILEMTVALSHFAMGPDTLQGFAKLAFFAAPLVLLELFEARANQDALFYSPRPVQVLAFASMACAVVLLGNYEGASFIYFQF